MMPIDIHDGDNEYPPVLLQLVVTLTRTTNRLLIHVLFISVFTFLLVAKRIVHQLAKMCQFAPMAANYCCSKLWPKPRERLMVAK